MPDAVKLGVLLTHPVQYYAPLFREVARQPGVDLTVYFAHKPTPEEQGVGFGVAFTWDTDLTGGYRHVFLQNQATKDVGTGFSGFDTPEIADIVRRERFDAFLVMGWHARTYWQGIRACWATRTPLLVRGDSQLPLDDQFAKRAAKTFLYPLFMRRFAACLSVGERSAEYFRRYGARRVVHSPHFVDNDYFALKAAELDRGTVRRELGIADDAFVALFAGKLIQKKRPLDVITAAANTGAKNIHVLVVGEGELRRACERAAAEANVPVTMAGFYNQSEMPRAYAAADVIVLPSDGRETWGLVVNEAMASGRCAVVADTVGCGPDLVTDGETGYVFPYGDVERLTTILREMAADPARVAEMGRNAQARVAAYSVEAATAALVNVTRELAGVRQCAA